MSFQISAIDDDELIHQAVRHGHAISLEIYLRQNPKCIDKIYTYGKCKWTPLLAACFYQYEHIVRMLLTRFKPEIETLGTITLTSIDSRLDVAEDVSALWVAAAVDHLGIVKLLIEYGSANVNHLIKTHSTAIRAACFHNNIEMVRYLVEHGANPHQSKKGNYTNLMLSAGRRYPLIVHYLVNEVQCNVNEQDENGQTALYYAVRAGAVEITKVLLEHGALNICDNKRKVTPLMRAALFGEMTLVNVFESYCSDLEWIEAKELLATSFAGCVSHIEDFNLALKYLVEAFLLRQIKNLPKTSMIQSIELLHGRNECRTLEEINQLFSGNRKDTVQLESLLIHQRILGEDHNDYHDVIHHYGATLARKREYDECLCWWFYELNLKQKYNMPIPTNHLNHCNTLFARMKFSEHIEISVEYLLKMFKIIDYSLSLCHHRKENLDVNLIILLHLITIVARIIYSKPSSTSSINYFRSVYKSIKCIIQQHYRTTTNGASFLHLCTTSITESAPYMNGYPCLSTIRLLIECGAHVNVFDFDGNTPLHNIVQNISTTDVFKIIDLLYSAGAHLDYTNHKGQTPLQVVSPFCVKVMEHLRKKMNVARLKCHCAKFIKNQKLLYEQVFSDALVDFIRKH